MSPFSWLTLFIMTLKSLSTTGFEILSYQTNSIPCNITHISALKASHNNFPNISSHPISGGVLEKPRHSNIKVYFLYSSCLLNDCFHLLNDSCIFAFFRDLLMEPCKAAAFEAQFSTLK